MISEHDIREHEPLISDARLAKIEARLRRDFPALGEDATLVTFVQPATFTTSETGVEVPLAEVAVLSILEPNPRHPDHFEMTSASTWFSTWRDEEFANRHSSEIETDPAYRLYRIAITGHLARMENLRSMN